MKTSSYGRQSSAEVQMHVHCTSYMHKTISEVTEVDMDKACDVLFMDNSCLPLHVLALT